MPKPECARLSEIQFHKRLKFPGAPTNDALAFDLDDLVTGSHAGGICERTLSHLRHENSFDERIEEKPFALQLSDETEFVLCGAAGRREDEQEDDGDYDPSGNLSEHRNVGPNDTKLSRGERERTRLRVDEL